MFRTQKSGKFPLVKVLVVALVLVLILSVWCVFAFESRSDDSDSEVSRRELARKIIAAVFQRGEERPPPPPHHSDRAAEQTTRNNSTSTKTTTRKQKQLPGDPQPLELINADSLKQKQSRMAELDLDGTWSLNRSEGFDEYLRETGVGMLKRKMATALSQTIMINQRDDHFRIEVTFIRVATKIVEFTVGDEFEIEVGPGVMVKVISSVQDGKLTMEGTTPDGKQYKNTRGVENGELVQIMQVGDAVCKRIFIRKS